MKRKQEIKKGGWNKQRRAKENTRVKKKEEKINTEVGKWKKRKQEARCAIRGKENKREWRKGKKGAK